jgi:hypothetical protein
LLNLPPPTSNRNRQHAARGKPFMPWLEIMWHRWSILRLAVRGVVLALAAWPLILLALKLQTEMVLWSLPVAIATVTGFVLIEAALLSAITFLFRKVR